MARIPIPPINPNNPIPNNPFYYPETNYIKGEYSPFIIGSGLTIDNVTGVISASGVGASLAAGPGINLTTVGTITTIANIGILSVTGTSPINVTAGQNPTVSVDAATLAAAGVVQLNNTTNSSSVSQALTAAAGKSLQDQINALVISNNLTLAGTVSGATGNMVSVTTEGSGVGFVAGSPLPSPSSANAEYFAIVSAPGTMTPPGGVATQVNQGDWWVSDGATWVYYPIGYDPTYATTTAPGVVQLATNAEVQAGTESTHAVTSSALQSKLSDSVNLASSTCIASSNAVRTANNTALAAQNDATSALAQVALAQADATQALADAAAAQFTADAAIPCACYTAKGDILGGTGAGTFSVLSPGTDGQMLYALSSASNGLQWADPPPDIPCSVITAIGDIVVGSGPATPTALPVGTDGFILAANSACATGLEWVANAEGDVTSVTGTAPITVDNSNAQTPIVGVNAATSISTGVVSVGTNINVDGAGAISVNTGSTTQLGVVSVGSNINVTAGGAISVNTASTSQSGVVQLNDTVTSTSTTEAATANAVNVAYTAAMNAVQSVTGTAPIQVDLSNPQIPAISADLATAATTGVVSVGANINVSVAGEISVNSASTSQSGVVQLNDTTGSTSTTEALTAAQGKNLQDQINALSITSNITLAGTLDTVTGNLVTVTTAGAGAGFAVGSPLPAAAAGNAEYFVIVTVPAASYTPPGGTATQTHVGDWFLSDGTVWNFLDVGFDPPYASTTTAGVVELSTDAETQAGTDSTVAVVPSSLQSKLSDSVATTSSTTIASSTAVKTAYDLAAAAIPCSTVTAKGALVTGTAASTPTALAVGTNGQVLFACSTCTTGLRWGSLPAAPVPAQPSVLGLVYGCTTDFSAGNNTSLGTGSQGECITTGCENVAVGSSAAYWMSSGCNNTAVGSVALFALSNATESCNTAIGAYAGANGGGSKNTLLGAYSGYQSGTNNLGGDNNTLLGFSAGCDITSGANNVVIGCGVTIASPTDSCQLAIGYALGQYWLTGTSTKAIKPGAGIIDCANSCGTNGQVLMSNGSNAICWGSPAATPAATPLVAGIVFACTLSTGTGSTALGSGALRTTPVGGCNVAVGLNAGCGINNGACNTAIGALAGDALTDGCNNTVLGFSALSAAATVCDVTAIGANALCRASGVGNTAVGSAALKDLTTGACNTAVGYGALCTSTTSNNNTAVGYLGQFLNNGGTQNTSLGVVALYSNVTGNQNTAIGNNALTNATTSLNTAVGACASASNSTGGSNTSYGASALKCNTTGSCNTSVGPNALFALIGSSNTALGYNAGCTSTIGSFNTVIGAGVQLPDTAGSCQLAIGFSSTCWLTGCSTGAIRPGAGIMDCAGSTGTAGQILTSNGSNAIQWATSTAPQEYSANKALTSGTPIDLLSWSGGVRAGALTVFATDNSTIVKWANITVGSVTGIGSTAVITQSVGMGNFTIVAGGSGETIVRFTPSTTLASVDFLYQYNAAFGAQPSVL